MFAWHNTPVAWFIAQHYTRSMAQLKRVCDRFGTEFMDGKVVFHDGSTVVENHLDGKVTFAFKWYEGKSKRYRFITFE